MAELVVMVQIHRLQVVMLGGVKAVITAIFKVLMVLRE
jgi:hypothetical protein